jgi:hypothetical protein
MFLVPMGNIGVQVAFLQEEGETGAIDSASLILFVLRGDFK